jgi:hypothetical protein
MEKLSVAREEISSKRQRCSKYAQLAAYLGPREPSQIEGTFPMLLVTNMRKTCCASVGREK